MGCLSLLAQYRYSFLQWRGCLDCESGARCWALGCSHIACQWFVAKQQNWLRDLVWTYKPSLGWRCLVSLQQCLPLYLQRAQVRADAALQLRLQLGPVPWAQKQSQILAYQPINTRLRLLLSLKTNLNASSRSICTPESAPAPAWALQHDQTALVSNPSYT